MEFEIPGKRTRGRPRRRWNDNIKEDMKKPNVSEEEVKDRLRWRMATRCCDPEYGMQRRRRRRSGQTIWRQTGNFLLSKKLSEKLRTINRALVSEPLTLICIKFAAVEQQKYDFTAIIGKNSSFEGVLLNIYETRKGYASFNKAQLLQ